MRSDEKSPCESRTYSIRSYTQRLSIKGLESIRNTSPRCQLQRWSRSLGSLLELNYSNLHYTLLFHRFSRQCSVSTRPLTMTDVTRGLHRWHPQTRRPAQLMAIRYLVFEDFYNILGKFSRDFAGRTAYPSARGGQDASYGHRLGSSHGRTGSRFKCCCTRITKDKEHANFSIRLNYWMIRPRTRLVLGFPPVTELIHPNQRWLDSLFSFR